ncbi:MAG: hypothetical protein K2N11_08775 [Mucispirillum sp.]|nr:hypothetical protein [Mucispirillum sp.]
MISSNYNENETKIKSHLKPLPDGSYEIYKNEIKSFYYVLIAFIFAIISIYFLKSGYRVIGNIFLAGFTGVALIALKMVLFKKTILTINDKFIFITPLVGAPEQVLWADITGFNEIREKRSHYIAVMINDPESVLEIQTNKLVYKVMHHNIKLYGTPYIIQTDTLSAHRREILDLLHKFQNEYLEKGVL